MRVFRLAVTLVIVAAVLAPWPQPAGAVAAGTFELKLNYWPTTTTQTYGTSIINGQGSWTTPYLGGDFRWTGNQHWGIHLKYDTGSEGAFAGIEARRTVGTDTVWSADVFYAWQFARATVRAFAGYGSLLQADTFSSRVYGAETLTGTGWRLGADAVFSVPNSRWAFTASAAFLPSTATTYTAQGGGVLGKAPDTSSGNAQDYSLAVQYAWPQGWLVEAGYRWLNPNYGQLPDYPCNPCATTTSGPTFAVGYRW